MKDQFAAAKAEICRTLVQGGLHIVLHWNFALSLNFSTKGAEASIFRGGKHLYSEKGASVIGHDKDGGSTRATSASEMQAQYRPSTFSRIILRKQMTRV